jgi:hypothetical protein
LFSFKEKSLNHYCTCHVYFHLSICSFHMKILFISLAIVKKFLSWKKSISSANLQKNSNQTIKCKKIDNLSFLRHFSSTTSSFYLHKKNHHHLQHSSSHSFIHSVTALKCISASDLFLSFQFVQQLTISVLLPILKLTFDHVGKILYLKWRKMSTRQTIRLHCAFVLCLIRISETQTQIITAYCYCHYRQIMTSHDDVARVSRDYLCSVFLVDWIIELILTGSWIFLADLSTFMTQVG